MRKLNRIRCPSPSPERGFTLIELMFGILMLSVLMALAVPSFRQYTASTRTSAASNSLAAALAVARSEALLRATSVSVCGSNDQKTCIGNPGTNWTTGWIAFTDATGTAGKLDGTDQLIQAWPAAGGTVTVTSTNRYVQYDARGMSNTLDSGGSRTAVTITSAGAGCTGNKKSQLVVTVGGSPQQSYVACP